MGGDVIGLVAVILSLGIPIAAMYTYFRIRKLRTEERLAAIARGVEIPVVPELPPAARSRKAAILLISGALGYMAAFSFIARITGEPDTWAAVALGLIPLAVGVGYLIDFTFVRRESCA